MNTITSRGLRVAWLLLASLPFGGWGQGIPEPSLIFYGTVRNTAQYNMRMHSGALTWQIRKVSTGRTILLSAGLSNYPGLSYVLEVPAETIVSGPVSSNALDLSASAVAFDRSQVVYDGTPVSFVTATQTTFAASSQARGRIERVDLLVSLPCQDVDGNGLCDDWELASFGYIGVDPNADSDGDGLSNLAEYQSGSDPMNRQSALQFVSYEPLAGGSMKVEWESAEGRSYRLWRTTNLWSVISTNLARAPDVTVVRSNIVATPPRNLLLDPNAVPPGPYFYRVELEP